MIPKLNIDFPFRKVMQSFVPWIKSLEYPSQVGNTFFLNHARTGLRIAISSLDLPKGSKIGMSMYNCLTVMNAVRVAGYEIVFLDITDDLILDLDDLDKKKSQLSALIVTHFYGIPNNMENIKSIVPEIPIIEDCAHAYGSLFSDGTKVGTKGDFSVFSIGLGKFPSIGDGGIFIVNNKLFINRVEAMVGSLPHYTFLGEMKLIIKSFAKYVAYRPLLYSLLLPLKRKKQEQGSFNEMYQHKEALMPKYVQYLYSKENDSLNEQLTKQIQTSYKIEEMVANLKCVQVPNIDNGTRNGFLFPIITEDAILLSQEPFLKQFELTSHFAKSKLWAQEFGCLYDCPNAEKISEHILVLPTHKNVKRH